MAKRRIDEFTAVTKALGDPNRVRALLALIQEELCVCQVVELLGLAPSTVSKHMAILKQAGLVESRKEGRWVYYRAGAHEVSEEVREVLNWVSNRCSGSREVQEDRRSLKSILSMDPEQLCQIQGNKC
jgi:DNA-binding transcriptional ArsR family regulator